MGQMVQKSIDKIKATNIFAAVSDKAILDPLLNVLTNQAKGQTFSGKFQISNFKFQIVERSGLRVDERTRFWGTQGTVDYLKSKGIDATSVVSGFDFEGRVKSLDKKVFAAILADKTNKKHLEELNKLYSSSVSEKFKEDSSRATRTIPEGGFDLVIVDLYKLDENNFPESMDIGGQALIRAAIKNYQNVALAFDASSLASLVGELVSNNGSTTLEFRKTQAQKAAKFIAERCGKEASFLND